MLGDQTLSEKGSDPFQPSGFLSAFSYPQEGQTPFPTKPRRKSMKHWIPAILLIAFWAVLLVILLTPEASNGHGVPHSKFKAMDHGGDGAARHEFLLLSGWMLGSVLIAIFVSLLAWGTVSQPCESGATRPSHSTKFDLRWFIFLIGGLAYEGVFGMMCLAYRNSLTEPDVVFLGPFPAGLAWLLFGVWWMPVFFVVVYSVFFDRWIMPPQSVQRFEELIKRTKNP